MTFPYLEIIREHARPLAPIATGAAPRLPILDGVRAVLFDVYGTLFISASGDVGTAGELARADAFQAALASEGLTCENPQRGVERLLATIKEHQSRLREKGVEYPEVDIREVWRDVIARLGLLWRGGCEEADVSRLAVEYEARTNPVWPMPELAECLAGLREAGLRLGVISNAQFFTPPLLEALLDRPIEQWGFAPELQFYSYEHRRAKPGLFLYELAQAALAGEGVQPDETLYVGNDMLNDVWPARVVGFRTALFAGDRRSYRRREDDERIAGVEPDLVLTRLSALSRCTATPDP